MASPGLRMLLGGLKRSLLFLGGKSDLLGPLEGLLGLGEVSLELRRPLKALKVYFHFFQKTVSDLLKSPMHATSRHDKNVAPVTFRGSGGEQGGRATAGVAGLPPKQCHLGACDPQFPLLCYTSAALTTDCLYVMEELKYT